MDLTSIELPGSKISLVEKTPEGDLRIRLEPAYLVKTMTGSEERTRWWQNMELVFSEAELITGDGLPVPAVCAGGDVVENVYTYRDMIPVPLESRGHAQCDLACEGTDQRIQVRGSGVRLIAEGRAKYIEHLRN